jgi:hypothetical protein
VISFSPSNLTRPRPLRRNTWSNSFDLVQYWFSSLLVGNCHPRSGSTVTFDRWSFQ